MYKTHITDQVKEFLYKFLVLDFLHQEVRTRKIFFAGEPQLTHIKLDPGSEVRYSFTLTLPESLALRGWKFYSFKPPKRKNYRDLDRQVDSFIQTEEEASQNPSQTISLNDWVCFNVTLVNHDKIPLFASHCQTLWLRLGSEEIDQPFQDLFLGKKIGDQFYTTTHSLQEYFSNQLDAQYLFLITIKDIISDTAFSLEEFKNQFRLRTNKEMHKKLIEVFSYHNDVSLRREMIGRVFKLLLSQHPFDIPHHLLLRRQEALMAAIQENPDYQVYRMQRDFEAKIKQLAENQLKEMIIIDQLSVKENLSVSDFDIRHYLNLTKRPRTREFIYFDLPPTRIGGQELPLTQELIKRYSLREKTLNYVIYHLTRN